jgi:hypothetical protein
MNAPKRECRKSLLRAKSFIGFVCGSLNNPPSIRANNILGRNFARLAQAMKWPAAKIATGPSVLRQSWLTQTPLATASPR